MTLHHCHSCNPTIIVTIITLSKSNGIQNLKITDLHSHLLFDSSMDPTLLPGVDDADDEDTSLAGVHDEDTSLAGVPIPNTTIVMNTDDDSDTESDHNSIDPNEAYDNSSKASIQALEATFLFTVPLVNHHNILWMRKPIFLKIELNWMT